MGRVLAAHASALLSRRLIFFVVVLTFFFVAVFVLLSAPPDLIMSVSVLFCPVLLNSPARLLYGPPGNYV